MAVAQIRFFIFIINSMEKTMLLNPSELVKNKPTSKKKQGGFDLIQIGIVVSIIGVLMASATVGVPRIMSSIRDNAEVQDMNTIGMNLIREYATKTIAGNENATVLAGFIPANKIVSGGGFGNRYGGELTITAAGTAATNLPMRRIALLSSGIPAESCEKLVLATQHNFAAIKVGAEMVKTNGMTSVNSESLKTGCGAGNAIAKDVGKGIDAKAAVAGEPVNIEFTYG